LNFRCGGAAQSALAQVFVVVDRPSDEDVFHIYADASYARHLDLWFADATLEFRTGDADRCRRPMS
jgi:sarcosine oxidase subunit gamma